jgi:hypothetical protein
MLAPRRIMSGEDRSGDGAAETRDERAARVRESLLALVREIARQAAREVFRGEAHVGPDHGDEELP